MLTSLRRGVLAGGMGGLLFGLFGYLLAEPLMDRAVDLESARQKSMGMHTVDLFTRNTQHVGLLVAALAVGIAFGVLFGVVHYLLSRDDPAPWRSALRLGAAAFFGLSLVPFLRYPANPPGVGESATIDSRSHLYVVAIVVGLVGACVAALVNRSLHEHGATVPARQLSVAAVLLATIALTFVLPGNTDPVAVPVTLIWQFRLLSIADLALLWAGLAVTFGLLGERARVRGSVAG